MTVSSYYYYYNIVGHDDLIFQVQPQRVYRNAAAAVVVVSTRPHMSCRPARRPLPPAALSPLGGNGRAPTRRHYTISLSIILLYFDGVSETNGRPYRRYYPRAPRHFFAAGLARRSRAAICSFRYVFIVLRVAGAHRLIFGPRVVYDDEAPRPADVLLSRNRSPGSRRPSRVRIRRSGDR